MPLYNFTTLGNTTNPLQIVLAFNANSNALFFSGFYIVFGLIVMMILLQNGSSKEFTLMVTGYLMTVFGVIAVAAGLLPLAVVSLFFVMGSLGMIMRARQPE